MEKNITYKKLINKIIDYDSNYIKFLNMSLPTNIYNCHYEFNPYEYLFNLSIINYIPSIYSNFYIKNITVKDESSYQKIEYFDNQIIKN